MSQSLWIATDPQPSRESLERNLNCDVVVVGAGITGLTTALFLQQKGRKVCVVEAHDIVSGTTGRTTGKVTSQQGLYYASLTKHLGTEKARLYAQANQWAIDTVENLVQRYDVDCQATRAPAFTYATDSSYDEQIEQEGRISAQLGLPASVINNPVNDIGLPYNVSAAVRFDKQLHLHAHRYCSGLARAIENNGGSIYTNSRVQRIDEHSGEVVTHVGKWRISSKQAVVATLLPFGRLGGYFARTKPMRSYGLACRIEQQPPQGMYISCDQPPRSIRPWITDNGSFGLIVVGNGHETGREPNTQWHYDDLETWTQQHFPVISVDYRWSAQDYASVDAVPYIGHIPHYEHVYTATGYRKWGLTNATVAAQIIADQIEDKTNQWLSVFDSTRVGGFASIGETGKLGIQVAKEYTTGLLQRGSKKCTHEGCPLSWNEAEHSWDCGCHGSRFDENGHLIEGPALKDLDLSD